MVVLLQLDDDSGGNDDPLTSPRLHASAWSTRSHLEAWQPPQSFSNGHGSAQDSPPRAKHRLGDLLACYPIVMSLVSNLDLNDLHMLSRSAYQIRERLLDYRHQIVQHTLHCSHEARNHASARAGRWTVPCARDLVGPCRRCQAVSCRNCTIKPPSNRELPRRYRRLCRACQKADLSLVTTLPPHPSDEQEKGGARAYFGRGPCTCSSEGVYICRDCHTSKGSDDINYTRVWTWRLRYHSLGFGLGTGIGEGNEGVKCGRGQHCLSARDIIVDMDCAENGRATAIIDDQGREILDPQVVSAALATHDSENHREEGAAGYYRQEIEGIGGVVKQKLKKRVRVGGTVAEHEDERETGGYLERERSGKVRGWCAWCDRIIPSCQDEADIGHDATTR